MKIIEFQKKYCPISSCEDLVKKIASKFTTKSVNGCEYKDIIQETWIGLLQAVKSFDPKKSCKFDVHAKVRIQYYLAKVLPKIFHLITIPQVSYWRLHRNKSYPFTFENATDEVLAKFNVGNRVPSMEEEVLKRVVNEKNYRKLRKCFKKLTERQRDVLNMYFWKNMIEEDIATEINLDRSNICKIKNQALLELKNLLKEKGMVENVL